MTSPRTLLGPLTTTWAAPPVCSYAMALGCDTCSTGWQGQTCNSASNAHDWTDCWPPRASSMIDPGVMMGWGFYSPGIVCPQGYTTAAMATAGGSTGWGLEYSLTDGETAAACCPTGFTPSSIETFNTYAATCVNLATSTSFSTVVCNSGSFEDFSLLELPNDDMKTFTVYAPLYQLNFQASDLPQTTESESEPTSTEDAASPSSTGSTMPSETGSSSTTSDPVASLIPSSLRSSVTSSATSTAAAASSGSGGSMSTGAKVGIGVGVGVGVILLLIAAFFVGRARRKDKPPVAEDGKGNTGSFGATKVGPDRKESTRAAELGGAEVSEMEGNYAQQELPATAISVGRMREPAAIFELEADNPNTLAPPTSRYGQGDTLVSPVTPTRQGAHSPVSPATTARPSHEGDAPMHQSPLRNGETGANIRRLV